MNNVIDAKDWGNPDEKTPKAEIDDEIFAFLDLKDSEKTPIEVIFCYLWCFLILNQRIREKITKT